MNAHPAPQPHGLERFPRGRGCQAGLDPVPGVPQELSGDKDGHRVGLMLQEGFSCHRASVVVCEIPAQKAGVPWAVSTVCVYPAVNSDIPSFPHDSLVNTAMMT